MAQKWQTISELAADTSRKVTHSPEEWCRFLTTAARFYKAYDFDDQLLIYAQKPDATACADMSTWNNKMRRWVNAGSTAIALIRKGYGGKPYLDYVHDVADTHPVRGGKDPWLWKLTEENREPVIERLRDVFGIDGAGDLGDLLMEVTDKLVQESYGEYLPDLLYEREDSFLEGLDDFNVEVLFRNTLRASVQYAVLSRCGLDVNRYLDAEDFREITNFNTTAALACLGTAVSQGSRELLLEIGDTIRKIEREKAKNPLAKSDREPYNDSRNFSTLKCERSDEHGDIDIHQTERVSGSQSPDGREGERTADPGPVRKGQGTISDGTPQGTLQLDAADRQAVGTSDRDRPDSPGTDGQSGGRDGEGTGRDRSPESQQSDGMGAADEQHPAVSGGNRPKQPDLQLNTKGTAGEQPAVSASVEIDAPFSAKPDYRQLTLFDLPEMQVQKISRQEAEAASSRSRRRKPEQPKDNKLETASRKLFEQSGTAANEQLSFDLTEAERGQIEPQNGDSQGTTPPPPVPSPEPTGAGASEAVKPSTEAPVPPSFVPDVPEYMKLKADHPGSFVSVKVGDYFLLYGEDAKQAAADLGLKTVVQEIPGLGETTVTGTNLGWPHLAKQLQLHGHNVTIGEWENGQYQIVKNLDVADFIPLRMKLEQENRIYTIAQVDYAAGRVSLRDDTFGVRTGFPIFRDEPVSIVREWVERQQEKDLAAAARTEEMLSEAYEQSQLDTAKRLITEFCEYEYGSEVDFTDLRHIGLACTTTDNEQHILQVEANLVEPSISYLLDGELVHRDKYQNLSKLILKELVTLDFDHLIRTGLDAAQRDPAAIQEDVKPYHRYSVIEASSTDSYVPDGGRFAIFDEETWDYYYDENSWAKVFPDAESAAQFIKELEKADAEKQQPDLTGQPITREGDTLTVGNGPATHEVDITVSDEEWERIKEAIPDQTGKAPDTVVPQNKVPVSCTKTANYNSSLINISFTVCQKKRRAFFLCVSGYFVIVVLTTIKKEKERILPQHVLSLTRECRKQCHCRIYVLIKIGFSADSGHINTIMIRKNVLFCKLIRIKKSSKVLFESYMASFCPERETCPICGSSGNCHVHAYYGRRIIDFIHGKPVTQEITVLRLVCVSCGHTHAVLPDMIIPYSGYGLFFILRVLAEAFLDRSSVEALCERFRITRNQFYKWKQIFSQHKQEWLGMLEHSETSGLDFLLGIARLPEYSLFSGGFADKTAYSFLQSHRNPPAMA